MDLNQTDLNILRALQRDGRMTNVRLAEHVNLSTTPCLRRLRRLEASGVIAGYSARLDAKAVGLEISAFAFVKLEKNTRECGQQFEDAVAKLAAVTECCLIAGSHDYVLRVAARDLLAYEKFLKDHLATIPVVSDVETTIILKQVMQRSELPL